MIFIVRFIIFIIIGIISGISSIPIIVFNENEYDDYIVIFRESVDNIKVQRHYLWIYDHLKWFQRYKKEKFGIDNENINIHGWLKHEFIISDKLRGYHGRFLKEFMKYILKYDDVAFVEKDQNVYALTLQKNAGWGLARLSHRNALNFSTFNKYDFDSSSGEGVTIYIIDTGINIEHADFGGRAKWGITIPSECENIDDNGHGTHVAGIAASFTYGVAKNASLVAVKVLKEDGSGLLSDVLKGIEWSVKMHLKNTESFKNNSNFKGSVANLSLGGSKSKILDYFVDIAVSLGLHFTVAAGNENDDACNYSPASSKGAITVGASTILDNKAYFSNFGKCVDIFAPGQNIISTWIGNNLATTSLSGTSMAAPYVCGLLAYLNSLVFKNSSYNIFYTSDMLKNKLLDLGTKGKLYNMPQSTANIIAYNGYDENIY
ncbi:hypothetical protein T552_03157 [Pneumocystis carinii B80]|uniref:Peptidase S8/S53 domain-containing protein n=1 Tax=Pneumocystis carinii (strain B80) TaxID=1408658 RepID=A0A0W4ZBZ7_PNEC8|nr:hypothetical protein T552_03157 [Pneumocystis carinii B80]KTW25884.1 hypothetical protein T552_03157 [Pneumocystis carinii B80]